MFGRPRTAYAHCDLPCGVYDPAQARIEAESCYKIIEKYHASKDPVFQQRAILIKEQRADLVKHHLDVLWHDYFKPEHVDTFPDLHDIFWKAAKQCSAVKASLEIADAAKPGPRDPALPALLARAPSLIDRRLTPAAV